jgi:hypothetical protein
MTDKSSAAPPTRNATPPHIAHLSSTALPTPPASQEKLLLPQENVDSSPSRSKVQPVPSTTTTESSKLDREARAAKYVLTFGTHKGKTLNEVARVDFACIQWLKTSGWADARSDLGDAMAFYDRQAVHALHEKYPKAPSFKFTFGKYLNKRMADVPGEFMESLIKDKHHMWSRRPGLREALLFWDEWACLGRQNWHRARMISDEEKEGGIRGANCSRRAKKMEVRQTVVW